MGTARVKSGSKTQATIAQSSAKSKFIASVKGAAEALGIVSLGKDLDIDIGVTLRLDTAAVLGILERRGVGRVRHLDMATPRLQAKELRRIIEMHKVPGLENPADLATTHLTREKIGRCCYLSGHSFIDGRSATTGNLHLVSSESRKWCYPTVVHAHGKEFGTGPDLVKRRPQVVSSDDDGGEPRGG